MILFVLPIIINIFQRSIRKMKTFLLLFAFVGVVFCSKDIVKKIMLTKEVLTIESPSYPNPFKDGQNFAWVLNGFLGNKISITCENIDITESPNCEDAVLLIRDGIKKQEFCGKKSDVSFETHSPSILLYLRTNKASGSFKCKAQIVDPHPQYPIDEENTFLEENQLGVLKLNGGTETGDTKTYVYKTNPNLKLKMYCKKFLIYAAGKPWPKSCGNDYIEVDTGRDDTIRECQFRPMAAFQSEGNKLVLRVSRRSLDIIANIECVVTPTNGKDDKYFKALSSEEVDSSEFGMKPGKKGTTCDCGRANKRSNKRIIFGTDAEENEFPWAVSLQYTDGFHFCGGAIVTHHHVITAAHCTENSIPSQTQVVAGASHYRNSPGRQVYQVLQILNHNYQKRPTRRDIAVVITRDKMQFSATVGPICLPKKDPEMVRKYITAVGWGQMANNETYWRDQAQLKKAHMRVVSPFECNSIWNDMHHDTKLSQICTFSNKRDICMGDSGGPVTWVDPETNRYFLVGLPSLCDGCVLQLPSIHTAVHFYHDWIKKIISGNEFPEEKVCTKLD